MALDLRDLPAGARYACHVQDANRKELGFIPPSHFAQAELRGSLLIQTVNAQPAGYLLHGPIGPERTCHVYQCAVQIDARRLKAATEVVDRLLAKARAKNARRIRLRCSAGIDANNFWRSCGFQPVAFKPGSQHRKNTLIVYERDLLPELF